MAAAGVVGDIGGADVELAGTGLMAIGAVLIKLLMLKDSSFFSSVFLAVLSKDL